MCKRTNNKPEMIASQYIETQIPDVFVVASEYLLWANVSALPGESEYIDAAVRIAKQVIKLINRKAEQEARLFNVLRCI